MPSRPRGHFSILLLRSAYHRGLNVQRRQKDESVDDHNSNSPVIQEMDVIILPRVIMPMMVMVFAHSYLLASSYPTPHVANNPLSR